MSDFKKFLDFRITRISNLSYGTARFHPMGSFPLKYCEKLYSKTQINSWQMKNAKVKYIISFNPLLMLLTIFPTKFLSG